MTKFMVQWEDHPSHLATRLGHLLEHQTLVDVTLMCNTHTLRVHRTVLAAGSPYFETILSRQLGQHPLIVLKDMQFNVLKSLIEFMYCGETSVTEENLPALLQAAKFFQVRGLSSMTKEALGLTSEATPPSLSIQGQPNPPGRQTTKRVNIQSMKSANATEHRGVGFRTVAKTIPSKMRTANTTDNAQLLLALSDSATRGATASTSRPLPPPRVGAGRGVPAPKTPAPQTKPTYNRSYKKSPVQPAPTPQPPISPKKPRGRYSKGKKAAPCYAPPIAAAAMTQGVLYQDPETNIIYQLEEPQPEAQPEPQPEQELPGEDEDVIYQLADGTITDRHGNPLLDKDGNQQNISSYQLEAAEPTPETDPYDMPILLDNGDGEYTAASVGADSDLTQMSVEQALEEMMGEHDTNTEETATVYSSTQPSILEETLRGTYAAQRLAEQSQASHALDPEPGFVAVDAQLKSEPEETEFVTEFEPESTETENIDFATEATESQEFATDAAESADFAAESGENYVTEAMENTDFVTESTENQDFVTEASENQDFVNEASENQDFVNEASENQDFVTEASENQDFVTEASENQDFVTESSENQDFVTESSEHAEFVTESSENFATESQEAGEMEAGLAMQEDSEEFVAEELDGSRQEGFNTEESEDFTADSDYVLDATGKVDFTELPKTDNGTGSNGVEDKMVMLGSSSLLKNALQKSGIDLDSLAPQFADMKPAVTYQISQVDGKQQVRLVNVGNDSVVLAPQAELPPGKRRASGEAAAQPAKRLLLEQDLNDE